jgi:FAD/FMN-containing dehydrogenase
LRALLRADGRIDSDAVAKLRARLKGRLLLASDAEYDVARRVFFWNPATERRPVLVVRCAEADDVRYAIEFARRHELEVAVRGGGHSPMGWGVSSGLVVDLSGMNEVSIDPVGRTARLGAGVLGGDVVRAAGRHGLAPILGQCPGVGAAGVTLGGGLGWLSGLHGAACDNLISGRVATADGRQVFVDVTDNPTLLWALRGAGANFGVLTSFECRLHPVDVITAGDIHYPVREARRVLRAFRDLMAEAPDAFQATINLTRGERGVFVSLCHAGEEAEAERVLRSLRAAAAPTKDMVRRRSFADLAGAPDPRTAAFRCITTAYRPRLSDDVIDVALDRLAEAPAEMVLGISHYMHGQVCRVRPDATAFSLRESGGVHIRIGMDWNDAASAEHLMAWADDTSRRLRPSSGERIYSNYQSHTGQGAAEALFGGNLSRLVAIKREYDPTNVFQRNSNVQP